MRSVNGHIVCKHKNIDKSLKTQGQASGFAQIQQKNTLISFEVLVAFKGSFDLKEGSLVFIREEELFSNPNLQKKMTCDTIEESFVLINESSVVMTS